MSVVRFDSLGVENVKDANDYLKEAGEDKLRQALSGAKSVEQVKQEAIESERQWPTPFDPDPASIRGVGSMLGTTSDQMSVLASAGGVGKISMQTVEALAIATGKPLLEERALSLVMSG